MKISRFACTLLSVTALITATAYTQSRPLRSPPPKRQPVSDFRARAASDLPAFAATPYGGGGGSGGSSGGAQSGTGQSASGGSGTGGPASGGTGSGGSGNGSHPSTEDKAKYASAVGLAATAITMLSVWDYGISGAGGTVDGIESDWNSDARALAVDMSDVDEASKTAVTAENDGREAIREMALERQEQREVAANSPLAGDPVAVATGELLFSATDVLFTSGAVKVALTRTYRSASHDSGGFGPHWSWSFGSRVLFGLGAGTTVSETVPDEILKSVARLQAQASDLKSVARSVETAKLKVAVLQKDTLALYHSLQKEEAGTAAILNEGLRIDARKALAPALDRAKISVRNAAAVAARTSRLLAEIRSAERDVERRASEFPSLDDLAAELAADVALATIGRARNARTSGSEPEVSALDPREVVLIDESGARHIYRLSEPPTTGSLAGLTTRVHGDPGQLWRELFPDGTVLDPQGSDYDQLRLEADGSITRTTPDGIRYRYSFGGMLRSVMDRNGNGYTIERSPNGTPLRIVDTYGRNISMETVGGRVRSVTNPLGERFRYQYDENGFLSTVTDPSETTIRYVYSSGRLTAITKPDGSSRSYKYAETNGRWVVTHTVDEEGGTDSYAYDPGNHMTTRVTAAGVRDRFYFDRYNRVTRILHGDGAEFDYKYDADGNIIETSDETDAVMQYDYDNRGRVILAKYPDGTNRSWKRNRHGQVLGYRDRLGTTTQYTYDERGGITLVTLPDGTTRRWQNNSLGEPIQLDDAAGSTSFRYDRFGYIASIIFPDGSIEKLSHDALGNLTSSTDASGNQTTYQYRPDGLLGAVAHPDKTEITLKYNLRKDLVAVTDERGDAESITYDLRHLPILIIDPAGNYVRYVRMPDGSIFTVARGRTSSGTHQPEKPTSVVRYHYDARGRIDSIKGPGLSESTAYTRDASGRITSRTDGNGHTIRYFYDPQGRLTQWKDPAGSSWTREYDAEGRVVAETDPAGNSRRTEYDPMGRIVASEDRLGARTSFDYDSNGNLVAVAEPNGARWRFAYDALGRRISQTDPNGATTKFAYSPAGALARVQDATGGITEYEYDKLGRVVAEILPDGADIRVSRDAGGNITAVTDEDGNVTKYAYDADNRPYRVTDASGASTRVTYDPLGTIDSIIGPLGGMTRRRYGPGGRLEATVDPLGNTTRYTYDAVGNLRSETNASGDRTVYSYDAADRLVTVTDPMGNVRRFAYDAVGNMIAATATGGATETFEYDPIGRPIRETNELGRDRMLTYDRAGNVVRRIDYGGNVTEYRHDATGNLTAIRYPDGSASSYRYDILGRLVSATNSHEILTYKYDKRGRIREATDRSPGSDPMSMITYAYDAAGHRTSVVDDISGARVDYKYNNLGEIDEVADSEIGTFRVEYDRAGREQALVYPNDTTRTLTYDRAGRITAFAVHSNGDTMSTGLLAGSAFVYDASGRKEYSIDPAGKITSYAYDRDGMLLQVRSPGEDRWEKRDQTEAEMLGLETGSLSVPRPAPTLPQSIQEINTADAAKLRAAYRTLAGDSVSIPSIVRAAWFETYSYDNRGNRVEKTTPERRIQYTYGPANRLLRAGNRVFEYDPRGNLIESATLNDRKNFQYDWENRLTSATQTTNKSWTDPTARNLEITYQYDPLGRRTSRNVRTGEGNSPYDQTLPNTPSTTYSYDAKTLDPFAAFDQSALPPISSAPAPLVPGNAHKIPVRLEKSPRTNGGKYRPSGSQPASSASNPRLATNAATRILRINDDIVGYRDHLGSHYIYTDDHGSVVLQASPSGTIENRIRYDAFGQALDPTKFANKFPFGYTGKWIDPVTLLYNYGFRDYAPAYGRFTSVDPIESGQNWYTYAGNNPVNFVDPWGLEILPIKARYLMQDRRWAIARTGGYGGPLRTEGCAVVAAAEIVSTYKDDPNLTPLTINSNRAFFQQDNIRFYNVARAYGLEYDYWTRNINEHLSRAETSIRGFYVAAEVPYNAAGMNHFVTIGKRKLIGGSEYVPIVGTSKWDTSKSARRRDSWRIGDDGTMYVSVSDIKKIVTFEVPTSMSTPGTDQCDK